VQQPVERVAATLVSPACAGCGRSLCFGAYTLATRATSASNSRWMVSSASALC